MSPTLPAGLRIVDVRDDQYQEWLDRFLGAFGAPSFGDPEVIEFFRANYPADRAIAVADGDGFLATSGSLDLDLVLPGGGTVPVAGLTSMTVDPTATRQGLAGAMMTRLQQRAVDEGRPAAVLAASEWPIYRRFGYGVASWYDMLSIDVRAAGWLDDVPSGGLRARRVTGEQARELGRTLSAGQARTTPGEILRPDSYWDRLAVDSVHLDGSLGLAAPGVGPRECVAVADRGLVTYRVIPNWTAYSTPQSTLLIIDFLAADVEAAADLWRHIFSVDLVTEVQLLRIPVDDPLTWWVADARHLRPRRRDGMWLRPLDVTTLLDARGWVGDGALTLAVHDREGYADGVFRLEVADGRGSAKATTAEPDLEMDVAELGAILLGGTTATAGVRAGRIRAREPRSAQLWDSLAAPERAPFFSYPF